MTSPKKPFLVRAWNKFWGLVTWLRMAVFNLLFLFLLAIVLGAIFGPEQKPLPDQAPLYVAPAGTLVDQYSYRAPGMQLLDPQDLRNLETRVRDLVDIIDHAAVDPRVTALILQLDHLVGGGVSKLAEVGQAVNRFKQTGKPVIAYSDHLTQQQYFLAAYADEIYLNDMGSVVLTGYGLYNNYFKEALDKLEVNFHVFRVGSFKDFVEPYTRKSMSEASREHNTLWLTQMWGEYTSHVETLRGMPVGAVDDYINNMGDHLRRIEGNSAELALAMGLVDHVGSRIQRTAALISRFGPDAEDENLFHHIHFEDYLERVVNADSQQPTGNIGLIVASGTILDGEHPEGFIGGDSLSELIRKARTDGDIEALVLRIDSGGGSAFASEVIRHELEATRSAGIPVVISMGSLAASGGYWIATAADEIWATPMTITGSIGVFGLFPTIEDSLAKLGIYTDGVSTTELGGEIRIDRPLSPLAANVMQQSVESIYEHFLTITAEARNKEPQAVHDIAQGRVWTGASAHELGLVDHLGYLTDSVAAAARLGEVENYRVKLIEKDLTPQEKFLRALMNQAQVILARAGLESLGAKFGIGSLPLNHLGNMMSEQQAFFTRQAPGHTYALCLNCYAP